MALTFTLKHKKVTLVGKNNVWILQFLFLPPLLLLRPQVPPILKPEASLIRPKVPMVFLSRGTSSLGKDVVVDDDGGGGSVQED